VSQACKACATAKVKCDNDSETCRRCQKKGISCLRADGGEVDTLGSCERLKTPLVLSAASSDSKDPVIQSSWSLGKDHLFQIRSGLTRYLGPEAVASGRIEAEVPELICSPTLDDVTIDTLFGNDNALFYDFLDLGNGWDEGFSTWQDDDALRQVPPVISPALEQPILVDTINTESGATPSEDFQNSWGAWHPSDGDYQTVEQSNLALPPNALQQKLDSLGRYDPDVYSERISPTKRDAILQMIYRTCEPEIGSSLLSPFPPEYFLDRLVGIFFTSHAAQHDTWIHIPTFKPCQALSELLVASIAVGGSLSSSRAVQAFGFALQETVAIRLPQVVCSIPKVYSDLVLLLMAE
jgi:hypothetical protein